MPLNCSSEQYAKLGGQFCPVCNGKNIDPAPPSWPENGVITMWIGCDDCRHVWKEIYNLTGFTELEISPQTIAPKDLDSINQ